MDGYADIRCDEDYERFYRAHAGSGTKLPPPLATASVYNQLQQRRQQAAMASAGQTAQGCLAALLLQGSAGEVAGGHGGCQAKSGTCQTEADCLDGKAWLVGSVGCPPV